MNSLKNIKKVLAQHKKELEEKYNIKELGLFGSVVRGEQQKKSDIDVLVEFKKNPDLFKFLEIERYLEKLLINKVDLIEKTALRPRLRERILGEVVYI